MCISSISKTNTQDQAQVHYSFLLEEVKKLSEEISIARAIPSVYMFTLKLDPNFKLDDIYSIIINSDEATSVQIF